MARDLDPASREAAPTRRELERGGHPKKSSGGYWENDQQKTSSGYDS